MASKADKEFLIRVKADIDAAVRDMQRMTGELRAQGKAAEGISGKVGRLGPAYTRVAAAAAAYLTAGTAIRALKLADEYAQIEARLKRVTAAQGDYNRVNGELFEIAQRNGTAFKVTANLFTNINRSAQELGASRDQVLAVADAVQQLGVLSGASDVALGNSLRQFSQAMAGGVLRAEEFNSIVENTPEIAQRIADGMEMTLGQLRLAVLEGKVLSQDVFNALLSQAPQIAKEMEGIPDTLERASNRLGNSFQRFVGHINEATGASQVLAGILSGIAATFDSLAGETLADIQQRIDRLDSGGRRPGRTGEMNRNFLRRRLEQKRQELLEAIPGIQGIDATLTRIEDDLRAAQARQAEIEAQIGEIPDDQRATTTGTGRSKRLTPFGRLNRDLQQTNAELATLTDERDKLLDELFALDVERTEIVDTGVKRAATVVTEAQRATSAATDAAREIAAMQVRLLESQGQTGLARIKELETEFLATVERMKQAGSEEGVEIAQQLFATDVARVQFEELLNQFEQAKARLRETERSLASEVESGLRKELELQEDIERARTATAAETAGMVESLKALGNDLGGRYAESAARAETSWAQMGESAQTVMSNTEKQIDRLRVIAEWNQAIVDVRHRVGISTDLESLREQEKANARQIELLEKMAALYDSIGDSNAAERVRIQLYKLRAELDLVADKFREVFEDAFTSFFEDIGNGTKSFGDALIGIWRDILREINSLLSKELSQQFVKLLAGKSGDNPTIGGRGLFSFLADLIAPSTGAAFSLFHAGGIIGQPTAQARMVSPLLFANAPRYHTGGLPGLMPGEVPIIAQQGEEILSRNDPRNSINGGAAPAAGNGVRIVNVIDPALVQDYMSSAAGEEVVLNVLSRRRNDVQAIVA